MAKDVAPIIMPPRLHLLQENSVTSTSMYAAMTVTPPRREQLRRAPSAMSDDDNASVSSSNSSIASMPIGVEAEFFRGAPNKELLVSRVQLRQTSRDAQGTITAFRVVSTGGDVQLGACWLHWSDLTSLVQELVHAMRPPFDLDRREISLDLPRYPMLSHALPYSPMLSHTDASL